MRSVRAGFKPGPTLRPEVLRLVTPRGLELPWSVLPPGYRNDVRQLLTVAGSTLLQRIRNSLGKWFCYCPGKPQLHECGGTVDTGVIPAVAHSILRVLSARSDEMALPTEADALK